MPDFVPYLRRPFTVNAVQITDENIHEIVGIIGGVVRQKKEDDGSSTLYIRVDRRVIPNIFKAYVGFWVTQLGSQYQCYSDKAFHSNFAAMTKDAKALMTKVGVTYED